MFTFKKQIFSSKFHLKKKDKNMTKQEKWNLTGSLFSLLKFSNMKQKNTKKREFAQFFFPLFLIVIFFTNQTRKNKKSKLGQTNYALQFSEPDSRFNVKKIAKNSF